jgi:hypothetical protein
MAPYVAQRRRAIVAVLCFTIAMNEGRAQTAKLSGQVVDKSSSIGVPRAEIMLLADSQHTIADSIGRFVFGGLPSGPQRFLIRALGFRPVELAVELRAGRELLQLIELESTNLGSTPQTLAEVNIRAPTPDRARLVDFERRRLTGRGHYLTDSAIKKSGASNLQDLTRGMRGVSQHCAGRGCRIQMVRAKEGCEPDYVVDGHVDNMFGSTVPIRDIIALEVYTGPADVPGEFAGKSAGCGVIVIWTRAGPPSRKR